MWGTNLERQREKESEMTCISIRQPHFMQSNVTSPMICTYVCGEDVKEIMGGGERERDKYLQVQKKTNPAPS